MGSVALGKIFGIGCHDIVMTGMTGHEKTPSFSAGGDRTPTRLALRFFFLFLCRGRAGDLVFGRRGNLYTVVEFPEAFILTLKFRRQF